MGCELLDGDGDVLAEVFRSDRDHKVIVSTFGHDVPLDAMEELLARARSGLDPFEDGDVLDTANNFGALVRP